MKTATGTKRIFAVKRVNDIDGKTLYGCVDQFGKQSGHSAYDAASLVTFCNQLNACGECASPIACNAHKRCILAEGTRLTPGVVKDIPAPQDWRDNPSRTYHWGVICVVLDREISRTQYTKARWFKTRAKARDYGPRNFRNFVIAEYRGE